MFQRVKSTLSGRSRAAAVGERNNQHTPILESIIGQGCGIPAVPHFEGPLCAELAWPNVDPPIAVLTGHQKAQAKKWEALGWSVHQA